MCSIYAILENGFCDKVELFPLEEIRIDENKGLIEEPEAIMAKETKKMRKK